MPHVQAMETARPDIHELLRVGLALLPVARLDLHRRFPPRHRVLGNFGPTVGFRLPSTAMRSATRFAVALQRAGYRTAMMGKYLNGYLQVAGQLADGAVTEVPPATSRPGWNEWDVAGWGYRASSTTR